MGPKAAAVDRVARSRALWRTLAALLIVGQAVLALHAMPMEDRWFLDPDDQASYYWARQVADHGTPTVRYDGLPLANVSAYPVFATRSALVNDQGEMVTFAPIGMAYLMALPASVSMQAVLWTMVGLTAATLVAFYFLAERLFGPIPATVALGAFAFSPSMVFWGVFPRSNVPAVGLLLAGLWCTTFERPWAKAVGGLLLILTMLLRYDYIVVVGLLGAGWLYETAVARAWTDRRTLGMVAGGLVGAVLLTLLVYASYNTINFPAIAVGQDPTGNAVEQVSQGVSGSVLRSNYERFLPVYGAYFVAGVAGAWLCGRQRWPILPLLAGSVAFGLVFFPHHFTTHDLLMRNSMSRYLLPSVAAGALGIGFLFKGKTDWLRVAGVAAVCLLVVLAGIPLATGETGLATTKTNLAIQKRQAELGAELNASTVFVGHSLAFVFPEREVVGFLGVPGAKQQSETLNVTQRLLELGYQVLGDNFKPAQYKPWFQRDARFAVQIYGADGLFYKVTLKRRA